MNRAKFKSRAPQARNDFIAAVTARAHLPGLSEKDGQLDVAASQTQGDVTLIAGQAWPAKVHGPRQQRIARIRRDGVAQTMEAVTTISHSAGKRSLSCVHENGIQFLHNLRYRTIANLSAHFNQRARY